MEKIDFLNYRSLSREVRQLRANLDALEASMYAPKGKRLTPTPAAPSGGGKTMADVVCKHMELEALYLEKLKEKNARLIAIETAIESLADPGERLVMRYRYIDGYDWGHVCGEMKPLGYAERTVYRLHGGALMKLKEV